MLASYLTGIPFSFTAHAKDIYLARFNPHGLLQTKIEKATFVATCTDANHIYLQQLCPQGAPIYTIYHGLDTHFFQPLAEAQVEVAVPVVLAVGRFVKKKGFPYLVQACRQLRDRGLSFKCRIIGQPDEDSQRVKLIISKLQLEEVVEVVGGMTQEDLRRAYAQATIFAMPCYIVNNGDRDGIPNVLAEAMAMALPVVASNISGIPELVEHEVNGLLVRQKDVDALADALATLLQDAVLRRRLGERARSTICQVFDSRQTTRMLHELFVGCLEKRMESMITPALAGAQSAVVLDEAVHAESVNKPQPSVEVM
jgi:glycosyltransferase involved in cell wall biosynthesis